MNDFTIDPEAPGPPGSGEDPRLPRVLRATGEGWRTDVPGARYREISLDRVSFTVFELEPRTWRDHRDPLRRTPLGPGRRRGRPGRGCLVAPTGAPGMRTRKAPGGLVRGLRAKVLAGLLLTVAGSPPPAEAQEAEEDPAVATARALVDAFNRHDPAGMAARVAPDFELYYVDDAGRAELAVEGPEALAAEMTEYFRARPQVRSEIEGLVPGGRFVAFRERIVGGDSSLAVYEIDRGRVRRAWYYPAEPDPPLDSRSPEEAA